MQCGMFGCIWIPTRGNRRRRDNRFLMLALERHLGGDINMEVFLDNVELPDNIGD